MGHTFEDSKILRCLKGKLQWAGESERETSEVNELTEPRAKINKTHVSECRLKR